MKTDIFLYALVGLLMLCLFIPIAIISFEIMGWFLPASIGAGILIGLGICREDLR